MPFIGGKLLQPQIRPLPKPFPDQPVEPGLPMAAFEPVDQFGARDTIRVLPEIFEPGKQFRIEVVLDFEAGQEPAGLGANELIGFMDHVEDHVVIGWIRLVLVAVPFRCLPVDLDITRPFHPADPDPGIAEIRTGVGIVFTGK